MRRADMMLKRFDDVEYDREHIPQDRLNLASRNRTSIFPWRGQFSPELVEILLEAHSEPDSVILDPFLGSGTTLFEAARKGLACYGTEINPSAVEFAVTAKFANLDAPQRQAAISEALSLAKTVLSLTEQQSLCGTTAPNAYESDSSDTVADRVSQAIQTVQNPLIRSLLANALIRFVAFKSEGPTGFFEALEEHCRIVTSVPFSRRPIEVFHADARRIPLEASAIDLVITSPPYINVFNYHQNNRIAMEALGWDVLEVAKSEIGSNRKNRANRFQTVIQYCLDMLQALKEMRRLLREDGRAILIVGRESKVRGVRFRNGRLVSALAECGAGFTLERKQERVFRNKFGRAIYEDILTLAPDQEAPIRSDDVGRDVAKAVLAEAESHSTGDVKQELTSAKERISVIEPSPIYTALLSNRLYVKGKLIHPSL